MKKILHAVAFVCLAIAAQAQNLTTVTGSLVKDLGNNLLGSGQVCFLATDASDIPVSFQAGGGGQVVRRPFCSPVTVGVITSFTVPNPALTVPAGINYRVTVKDTTLGSATNGQEILRYKNVSFVGAGFNFDAYGPTIGNVVPLTGTSTSGSLAVNGNLTVTGSFSLSNLSAIRFANNFAGGDVGAKINAADADLGATAGEIWYTSGGTISTQIVISANHKLRLFDGTYTPAGTVTTSYLQAFPIALQSNSSLECESWNTILVEPTQTNIWTIVAPFNAMNTSGARGTDSNVSIKGCHFTGAHGSFNSAPSTVGMGNCNHCSVTNNWFDGTRTLQLTAGGSSATGNHAVDIWATDNLFTQSASQSLSCVNCKDFHFNRNTFIDAGQVGGAGVTFIDLEPNASTDWMEDGEIGDNVIDNLNGQNTTAGGITVQNANLARFGPISVHDNVISGGSIDGVTAEMAAGIVVNSSTRDVSVTNNFVRRVQQNGIVAGGDRTHVSGNRLICVGSNSNGFPALSVLGTNGTFSANIIVDPGNCGGSDATITESGAADANIYVDNVAQQAVLIGANSRVANHIDSTGLAYFGSLYFNGTLYGGLTPTALAQPTINSGGSGGTTVGGGTLANATYGYKVTAVTQSGETAGSAEVQKTTSGGQNAVSLLINGVSGASSYRIYGRAAGGPWSFIASIPGYPSQPSHTLTYIDKGTITPSGAIPTVDTSAQVAAALISGVERVAPVGVASSDQLWADSTSHRWKMNNNNGGAKTVAELESPAFTTPNVGAATASSVTSATANPASAGFIRAAKTDALNFRNNANGADINGMSLDASDVVQVGGNTNGVRVGATGAALKKVLTTTSVIDFGAQAANTCTDSAGITLTGALDGDSIDVGVPAADWVANVEYSAYVSAADTVKVRLCNNATGASADPASGTFRVTVRQY